MLRWPTSIIDNLLKLIASTTVRQFSRTEAYYWNRLVNNIHRYEYSFDRYFVDLASILLIRERSSRSYSEKLWAQNFYWHQNSHVPGRILVLIDLNTNNESKLRCVFRFRSILSLSKTCWQLEAIQIIVTKGKEITDHKNEARYSFVIRGYSPRNNRFAKLIIYSRA